MKVLRYSLGGILFLLLWFPHLARSQSIPPGLSVAFKAGNSQEVAEYFNTNVQLVVLDKDDVYSQQQAKLIMKDFFAVYKPRNFLLIHQGEKSVSKYVIGNLSTNRGVFRVYMMFKRGPGKPLISLLRVEKV